MCKNNMINDQSCNSVNDRACFTSGLEVETGSYYYRGQGHGRYLILQIDDCDPSSEDCRLSVGDVQAFCPQLEGSYTPGTPGGPWTEDEVLIVKEKVRFIFFIIFFLIFFLFFRCVS